MNRKTLTLGATLAGLTLGASSQFAPAAAFTDTFDSIDPAWVTDRYEPAGFAVENFGGDNRLRIDIDTSDSAANRPAGFSGAFYNTQGRQRAAAVAGPWMVSGDLYFDSEFNTTTGQLARTDIWARDSNPVEAVAQYPIFGITNASPSDAFNPAAPDRSFRLRAWDAETPNGWVDIAAPAGLTFDAWHNLSVEYTGTSFVYKLDGNTLFTDATASLPAVGDLQTVFLEAYNFGDDNYAARWDNVTAVPEPAGLGLLALGGVMLLGRCRRR